MTSQIIEPNITPMSLSAGMKTAPTPDRIMQVGLGYWGSKTLLSAVELGLFTLLAERPRSAEEIRQALSLHPRSLLDFLDALLALGFLDRRGDIYSNTPETDLYLDRNKLDYIGGILEMAGTRLFRFWGSLTDALKTGEPQNESRAGENPFDALYATPERLAVFLRGMTGISLPAARALAAKFPWEKYETVFDVGCAEGIVPVIIAQSHPHIAGGGFDLPAVGPHFARFVQEHGVSDRLKFIPGNFFQDSLPGADVLIMGHILHDWDLPTKKMLLKKAFDALPRGGALIVYEALIDDERRSNAFGLLMSLNMLIETSGGFDYTGAQCSEWMREAGFTSTRVEHLVGPDSMVVGIK